MALAILELIDADETQLIFRVDTGTNTQFQLKFGRAVREENGNDWVDDVYYTTQPSHVDAGPGFFGKPLEISITLEHLEHGRNFVQLVTAKAGGKAQACSDVIAVPRGALQRSLSVCASSLSLWGDRSMSSQAHKPARRAANRTLTLSHQASLESLLGEIVKVASPLVLNLLKEARTGGAAGTTTPTSAAAAGSPSDLLVQILQSVLGALAGSGSAPALSQGKSLRSSGGNRFSADDTASYAKPFIFGIDDALIASLVGPVLQVLPQLVNAVNQKRIEFKKADIALMGGILSDLNKRMMMAKLLEAQQAAQAQGPAAPVSEEQLQALAALISQLPAPAAGSNTAPLTAAKSLSGEVEPQSDLSAKALLAFEFSKQIEWNGVPTPVFDRSRPLLLKPRFTVLPPAPKAPLSKAILKLALFDPANAATRYEKLFKLKDVLANGVMECSFEPVELSHLPTNCALSLIGELRWKNARTGRETRALGASEIVLVSKYFIKARGAETSAEYELADMVQFRAFWNKVWEAPVLDAERSGGGRAQRVWDLDVHARYTTLLTAAHDSNGMMETKFLTEAVDPERTTLAVHGRMKAGMELSVAELNKLITRWNGPAILDPAKLEALSAPSFLQSAAREFKYNFKLKGRAGQNGMIWVVPIFKLFGLTLSSVVVADDTGQVTTTSEEDVQFPLPVAARLIGLKSAA